MAGDTREFQARTGSNVRIIKDVYPPRLKFNYVLRSASGSKVKSGSASLKDLNDTNRSRAGSSNRNFYFELTMLERWVRQTLPE
ncbi:MAG: DUF3016 domain-containing protein [Verrucomicrobiales bacterium]|nr:DUF3016 domain-containing protein [Verrucomicrobiales bacterium]